MSVFESSQSCAHEVAGSADVIGGNTIVPRKVVLVDRGVMCDGACGHFATNDHATFQVFFTSCLEFEA